MLVTTLRCWRPILYIDSATNIKKRSKQGSSDWDSFENPTKQTEHFNGFQINGLILRRLYFLLGCFNCKCLFKFFCQQNAFPQWVHLNVFLNCNNCCRSRLFSESSSSTSGSSHKVSFKRSYPTSEKSSLLDMVPRPPQDGAIPVHTVQEDVRGRRRPAEAWWVRLALTE